MITISTSRILDSVHALAALEMLTASESTRLLLAPLLDRGRRSLLAPLVLDSFASALLEILPYVESTGLGGEEDPSELPELLRIDLRLPRTPASATATLVRRNLEIAVTFGVLETALLGSAPTSSVAGKFASRRAASIATLLSALHSSAVPPVRTPSY